MADAQELFDSGYSTLNVIILKGGDRSWAHEKILWGKHGQVTKLKKLWWSKTTHLCSLWDSYEMFWQLNIHCWPIVISFWLRVRDNAVIFCKSGKKRTFPLEILLRAGGQKGGLWPREKSPFSRTLFSHPIIYGFTNNLFVFILYPSWITHISFRYSTLRMICARNQQLFSPSPHNEQNSSKIQCGYRNHLHKTPFRFISTCTKYYIYRIIFIPSPLRSFSLEKTFQFFGFFFHLWWLPQ